MFKYYCLMQRDGRTELQEYPFAKLKCMLRLTPIGLVKLVSLANSVLRI